MVTSKEPHKEHSGVYSIPSGTSIPMTTGTPKPGVYMEGLQLVQACRDHSATCSLPSSSQGYGCITEAHTNKSNPSPGYSDPAKRLIHGSQFVIELDQTSCLPLALCKNHIQPVCVLLQLTWGTKPNSTEMH